MYIFQIVKRTKAIMRPTKSIMRKQASAQPRLTQQNIAGQARAQRCRQQDCAHPSIVRNEGCTQL